MTATMERLEAKTAAALGDFRRLAHAIANGEDVADQRVDEVLTAAGKGPADLRTQVGFEQERRQAHEGVAQTREIKADMLRLREELAGKRAELFAATDELVRLVGPRANTDVNGGVIGDLYTQIRDLNMELRSGCDQFRNVLNYARHTLAKLEGRVDVNHPQHGSIQGGVPACFIKAPWGGSIRAKELGRQPGSLPPAPTENGVWSLTLSENELSPD